MNYKFKVGDKCKTRDGDDAEVIHIIDKPVTADGKMVVLITCRGSGLTQSRTYYANGSYYNGSHRMDLIPPKPEPTYRPYETKEEIEAMRGEWVQLGDLVQYQITGIDPNDKFDCFKLNQTWESTQNLLDCYTHLDGTPCGVEVTE